MLSPFIRCRWCAYRAATWDQLVEHAKHAHDYTPPDTDDTDTDTDTDTIKKGGE